MITVRVGRKHIEKGVRWSGQHCPIALALKGMGYWHVYVTRDWTEIKGLGPVTMTTRARNFIDRFDGGRPVRPATFRLPLGCQ
jgi:hypothetical protein